MKGTLRVFLILSYIAGFADTATFTHLSGLFSSHVTGNFVLLAATIGHSTGELGVLKLLAFPVFVIAVSGATLIHDWRSAGDQDTALHRGLSFTASALLLCASTIAFFYGSRQGAFTQADAAAGMIAVMAMGIQNAIHRFAAPLGPATTVMTGNVTQLTMMATRLLTRGRPSGGKAPLPPFSLGGLAGLAAAFALGCLSSALATLAAGLVSLAIPGLLLLAASLWERPA